MTGKEQKQATKQVSGTIASFIGEGVHTAMRKYLDSHESNVAWHAIRELPRGEWGTCTTSAAEVIVDYLISEEGAAELKLLNKLAGKE